MQSFQVTSPNICGLVVDNVNSKVLSYLDNTTSICHTNDIATFEEFTTLDAAGSRASAIQVDFELAKIFGTVTLIPVNLTKSVIETFERTPLTINAEYTLPNGTLAYQWRTSSGLAIPGATNSSLTFTSPLASTAGTYVCDVVGTVTKTGAVGRVSHSVQVNVYDAL